MNMPQEEKFIGVDQLEQLSLHKAKSDIIQCGNEKKNFTDIHVEEYNWFSNNNQ